MSKRRMPRQKPGESEQSVGTPPMFIQAACRKLRIPRFNWDLAADRLNSVCGERFYGEEENSLVQPWTGLDKRSVVKRDRWRHNAPPWNWLNPPFADIAPWAERCVEQAALGAYTAFLVPCAMDTRWWNDSCHGYGYVLALQSRIQFVGHTQGYPKGLALILYTPTGFNGYDLWDWKAELKHGAE